MVYSNRDNENMRKALGLAEIALEVNEVPVGAVVVSAMGEVLGVGYNRVEELRCQTEHAEARAIREATHMVQDWRLNHCTIYVTLEPCMMCMSLIALSRIERVVFAAESPLFGYHLDREGVLELYTSQIKNITKGVMEHEAAELLKLFFQKNRNAPVKKDE